MKISNLFYLFVAAALMPAAANAHSDILLRGDSGQVVIGAAEDLDGEEGGPFFELGETVFEGVFLAPAAPIPPFFFDFQRDEPGFFSAPGVPVGDPLPADAAISWTQPLVGIGNGAGFDSTFYWDGTGEVDFQPLSTEQPGVSLDIVELDPLGTDEFGAIDNHPLFGLTAGAADGVYLSAVSVGVEGLDPSDPFFMVWLADGLIGDEDTAETLEGLIEEFEEGGPEPVIGGKNFAFYEEAVEFADGIPEPSSAVLMAGLALSALAARRR